MTIDEIKTLIDDQILNWPGDAVQALTLMFYGKARARALQALCDDHTKLKGERDALLEAANAVIRRWHEFESHDDGDKGYRELGDKLQAAIALAKE